MTTKMNQLEAGLSNVAEGESTGIYSVSAHILIVLMLIIASLWDHENFWVGLTLDGGNHDTVNTVCGDEGVATKSETGVRASTVVGWTR